MKFIGHGISTQEEDCEEKIVWHELLCPQLEEFGKRPLAPAREKFCGRLWNGQSVWSQIVRDPFPGELRIVLARGEGGKGKKWETRSSGILQYCSASIRPLQTSTKLTFNQTTSFNHLQLQGLKETYGIGANPADLLKRPFQPWTPEAWSRVGPGSAGSGKIMDTNDSNDTIFLCYEL